MYQKNTWFAIVMTIIVLALVLSACSGNPSPSTSTSPSGIGGGAVVQSDSVISGEIKAIRQQSTGYPWEVDVLIQSTQDVDSLPNPIKDKVGQVVTAKTDEDMKSFKVNEPITAKMKYVGDVPKPGISLYMYNLRGK